MNIVTLTQRLTDRDLWLIAMLHEHRVLTTPQITRLAYTSTRSAQRRLHTLHHLTLCDSFRPLTHTGSAPEHYTLGRAGAALLAARAGCDLPATGWRPTSTARIAYSPTLTHDLATNNLLTHLTAQGRTTTSGISPWLSEKSCARRWGDLIRPDAYAHWHNGTTVLPFFLEHDTGSQTLARVEAKLPGYAAFTTATTTQPALLIHTSTHSRAQALRRRLTEPTRTLGLHLAIASADHTTDTPWARWWTPLTPPTTHPLTLAGLTTHWPHLTPAPGLQTCDSDTPLTLPVPPLPPATRRR